MLNIESKIIEEGEWAGMVEVKMSGIITQDQLEILESM
jgi:hypothetical protein